MMKRLIALLICLSMIAALAGCGSQIEKYEDAEEEATPTPEAVQTEQPEDGEEDAEPEPTADPGLGYAAYEPGEVVAEFDGQDITWREYYYWLSYYVDYMQYLAMMGAFTFSGWDGNDLAAENNNAEVIRMSAMESMFQYHAIEAMAAELGVELTDEDEAEIQAVFDESADSFMGDGDGECTEEEAAAYQEYLDSQFVDRELFDYMSQVGVLADKTFTALYGEAGADFSDAETLAYADEQGMMRCKHILLMTVDVSTGEALSAEEIAQQKEKIDALYAQLAEVQDDPEALEALFDELMNENSQDTGLIMYPDGYLFTSGTMVPAFEQTTASLAEYGLSEPVESSYGYHIILRLPINLDEAIMGDDGTFSTLRTDAANDAFFKQVADRVAQMMDNGEVVWNGDFETLDLGEIFGE